LYPGKGASVSEDGIGLEEGFKARSDGGLGGDAFSLGRLLDTGETAADCVEKDELCNVGISPVVGEAVSVKPVIGLWTAGWRKNSSNEILSTGFFFKSFLTRSLSSGSIGVGDPVVTALPGECN
jgi:hypothetical protein